MKRRFNRGREPVRLAVATTNGALYYAVTQGLQRRGIRFLTVNPRDKLPLTIKAVITSLEEAGSISHSDVVKCGVGEEESAVSDALKRIAGVGRCLTLTVGVDPGETIGLAVLADDHLLHVGSYRTLKAALDEVEAWRRTCRPTESIVKLGVGNGQFPLPSPFEKAHAQLEEWLQGQGNVRMLLVNESFTTKDAKRLTMQRKHLDEASALSIALK